MRFRIQTCPPLPEVKIWFIPEDKEILVTVHDLKDAVCRRIPAVNESRLLGHDLGLFLDDFELLDDSPFSAVRDGDTLCVKVASVQAVKVKAEGLLGACSLRPSFDRLIGLNHYRRSGPRTEKETVSDFYSSCSDTRTVRTGSYSGSETQRTNLVRLRF